MKKIFFLICILSTTFGFTQDAKALLDEVSQKVKSYTNIYIEFEHDLDNMAANIHQSTSGNATIQGDLYRFEVDFSGIIEQLFDGEKLYQIIHEDQEVIILNPKTEDGTSLTPSKMLTFYEKGFTYQMDIAQNVNGKKIQYVKLIPIDSDSELANVLLGIDMGTKNVFRVIENGIDDTVTTYTISKFNVNQSLPSDLFSFDKVAFEEKGYDITEPK